MTKQAVVFALPGTSSAKAAATLRHVDELFGRRFAGMRRVWAYTSSGVRRKLEQDGRPVDDPAAALARLQSEGFTHVAVKSLHLAGGMEYNELKELVRAGTRDFSQIVLSTPLLETPADFEQTVRFLLASLPPETGENDAVLLVTHGSRQPAAQLSYEAAARLCRKFQRPVLLGSLMSRPGLDDVARECKAAGIDKLVLVPLMIAAGFSATTEIAGTGPESWASSLGRAGIRCESVIRGLGDHDDIVELWLDDVERLLAQLADRN